MFTVVFLQMYPIQQCPVAFYGRSMSGRRTEYLSKIFSVVSAVELYLRGTYTLLGNLVCTMHMCTALLYMFFLMTIGKIETETEVLRSILAQLEFSWLIWNYHDSVDVPFRHYLYVPEILQDPFCEREDEAHTCAQAYTYTMYIYMHG